MKKTVLWVFACLLFIIGVNALTVHTVSAASNYRSASSIEAKKVMTGDEDISKFPKYTVSLSREEPYFVYSAVVPLVISEEGRLYLDLLEKQPAEKKVEVLLYYDKNCEHYMDDQQSLNTIGNSKSVMIEKAGTYYLKLTMDRESDYDKPYSVTFRPYFYSTADQTLKNGVWTALSGKKYYEGTYYKIVVPSDGHINVEGRFDGNNSNMDFAICNSDKFLTHGCRLINGKCKSYFLKKGTYYIFRSGSFDTMSLRYTFSKLGSSPFTIKKGQSYTSHVGGNGEEYVKYKAASNGYITITCMQDHSNKKVNLCNSARKEISFAQTLYKKGQKCVYGVKKGQTYYLKVSESLSYNEGEIKFKLTEKAIPDKSGSSKAKAASLKAGSTAKGVLEAGGKTSDWYKFKLSKKKKITFTVKGEMNGAAQLTLYNKKGKTQSVIAGQGGQYQTYKKLDKGTYYVKVSRITPASSGYYTLKWK